MGGQIGPSLVLTSSQDGSPVHIPQKSAFAPHKTLGHWKAPAGNGSKQLQVLRKKSQAMASQLLVSPIQNYEAWLLLYWSNPVSQVLRAMAFKRTTRGRSNFGELMTVKIS
jgi:hypothetical protein